MFSAGVRTEPHFSGVPVLFMPGSGGSYKQVSQRRFACGAAALTRSGQARSLASETAKQHNAASTGQTRVLDWYAFDFQEELSGLDGEWRLHRILATHRNAIGSFAAGSLLYREANFVTRCMLALEKHYADAGSSPPFLLVGHSMGGLVAQVASADARLPHGMLRPCARASHIVEADPRAMSGLLGAVVTLATPLVTSPWLGQVRASWRTSHGAMTNQSCVRMLAARTARNGLLLPPCTLAGGIRAAGSTERRVTVRFVHAFPRYPRSLTYVRDAGMSRCRPG